MRTKKQQVACQYNWMLRRISAIQAQCNGNPFSAVESAQLSRIFTNVKERQKVLRDKELIKLNEQSCNH